VLAPTGRDGHAGFLLVAPVALRGAMVDQTRPCSSSATPVTSVTSAAVPTPESVQPTNRPTIQSTHRPTIQSTIQPTTLADDEAVVFVDGVPRRYQGLDPDTDYDLDGVVFRTLPRRGELLCRVTTVNDVHFGETLCGELDWFPDGPVFSVADGETPYPEVMNRGAVAEMAAIGPDAVVVKGDLTSHGTEEEYEQFLAAYVPTFGDRLHHVRGNHDAYHGQTFADHAPLSIELPGVRLAVIDTVLPGRSGGQVSSAMLAWLDELAQRDDDRPLLVFGHHPVWDVTSGSRDDVFGVNPDDSKRLVELVARRPAIVGYFAGHTHRNRVQRFASTAGVPWVEVACVKDFPGTWAEYRVFDGGILQVHHRISTPEALAWSERTKVMFSGLYEQYAFGASSERNFEIRHRPR